jgi:hypothetical protein
VALTAKIHAIHRRSRESYGAPRIHAELADEHGIHVGRKRVARLMRAARLRGVSRRRFVRTTVPDIHADLPPDLVDRNFRIGELDRLWVADITYIPTWAGFLYLAIVLDACSRRVIGWAMENHLRTELVLAAINMALSQRRPEGVIHHSDHGCQPGLNWSSQHGLSLQSVALPKSLGWRTPAEALTGSGVECKGDGLKVVRTMHTQIGALREVLSQQAVGVLVGAALPWALGIAEIDMQSGVDAQARMLAHLCALIPCQRPTQLLGEGGHSARNGVTHGLSTMARKGRPILRAWTLAVFRHWR